MVINLFDQNKENWVIGNLKHSGFYRVNYDNENWNLLIAQLNSDAYEIIDDISRAQLIDDSFSLGRAEIISQTIFLNVVKYLKREISGIPFEAAVEGFNYIDNMLSVDYIASESFKVFRFKCFFDKFFKLKINSYLGV